MRSDYTPRPSHRVAFLGIVAVVLLVVLPALSDANESTGARRDLIVAIKAYQAALERLLVFHEAAVARAAAQVEQRRELHARGIVNPEDVEMSERALATARAKLAATRQEMVITDRELSAALTQPSPATSSPSPQPTRQAPPQRAPKRPPPLAWAGIAKPGMPDRLRAGGLSPSAIFSAVEKSVYVLISTTSAQRSGSRSPVSQGSAVAITPRIALTNCHVLEGNAVHWLVRDETILPVSIAYGDKQPDRCAVAAESGRLAPIAGVRQYSSLAVGERVYTIGSPSGLENTLGEGIISGLRPRGVIDLVQTTAPISSGSSGGGLFDGAGNLIGITTFQLRDSQNLNFAIAADTFWK